MQNKFIKNFKWMKMQKYKYFSLIDICYQLLTFLVSLFLFS